MGLWGIHSVRMRKHLRPNLILPSFLADLHYDWQWTLESSMQDWKAEKPEDRI